MATYLRFTKTAEQDIENGFSYLKTPSMKKAKKLEGLCAFSFDTYNDDERREMTEDEVLRKIKRFASNQYYLDTTVAVLIEGDYVGTNPNGEGVLIRPNYIIQQFEL